MKKLITVFLLMTICIGCSTKIINVDGKTNDERTSFNAFNDESYVWEGWSFSTNKVDKVK